MRNFIFHNPVRIYFGEGQAAHVAEEARSRPGAVLLVYGGGSINRNGAYDDVTAALHEAGNEVVELSGVTPNPRLDKVLEGVNLVREHGVSLILAVGGGSVIDCAKFISLGSGLSEDEDLWDDYVETGKPAPENLVPIGVVLTTAATGSEMGDAAVLTNWSRNRKLGYTSFPPDAEVLGARPDLPAHPAGRTDHLRVRGHVLPHLRAVFLAAQRRQPFR